MEYPEKQSNKIICIFDKSGFFKDFEKEYKNLNEENFFDTKDYTDREIIIGLGVIILKNNYNEFQNICKKGFSTYEAINYEDFETPCNLLLKNSEKFTWESFINIIIIGYMIYKNTGFEKNEWDKRLTNIIKTYTIKNLLSNINELDNLKYYFKNLGINMQLINNQKRTNELKYISFPSFNETIPKKRCKQRTQATNTE